MRLRHIVSRKVWVLVHSDNVDTYVHSVWTTEEAALLAQELEPYAYIEEWQLDTERKDDD
jgi:hypothetical protein